MIALPVKNPAITGSPAGDPQMAEVLTELRMIHEMLAKHVSQPNTLMMTGSQVTLPLRNSYTLGKADAPVTLVEFTDYQCAFCKQFADENFPLIKKNYIDTGKVRFISRYLPQPYHLQAVPAARAALCAGEQGKYWEMREALFKNNSALMPDDIMRYARDIGLNMDKFKASFNSTKYQDTIRADSVDAAAVGIGSTPTFIIGKTGGKESLVGQVIIGTNPYATYETLFNKLIAECTGGVCQ